MTKADIHPEHIQWGDDPDNPEECYNAGAAAERRVWTRLVDDIMVAAEALTDSDYGEVNEENLDNLGDALSRMRDATDAAR